MESEENIINKFSHYWHEEPASRFGWQLLEMEPNILEVGDVVHVQGDSVFSKII